MKYVQLITPNPSVPCEPGYCLKYVQDAVKFTAKYPSAIAAWNASNHKHTDLAFPDGVWVPVWFTLSDNPYGHVVWLAPDKTVYSASSPTSHTAVHHASLGALDTYYGKGRLKILGWTEDVEGTLVIKQGEAMQNGDIDNLLKDFGITPVPADYEATKLGAKDFAYWLQVRLKGSLVHGDVDNLLKDVGITPTQADYDALKSGPKNFAYYLQTRLKPFIGGNYVAVTEQLYKKK